MPLSPCGTLRGGIAHLARLLAEDRAQQALLRGQIGLALGRDLADQNIAGVNLRADADDTALVEVLESVLADVGNVARDLLGAELGVAGVELILLEVDGGIQVLADKALVEEHRVLVVVALPRHETDEDVASERQLALIGGRAVRQHGGVDGLAVFVDILAVHALADVDDRVLVDAGSVVGAQELGELVFLRLAVVVSHGDGAGVHLGHDAVALGEDGDLRSPCRSCAPCRYRRWEPRGGAEEQPDAAYSRPSGHGSRRRSAGTGSSRSRWRPSCAGKMSM